MEQKLAAQLVALQEVHSGLTAISETEQGTVISGSLPFEASVDGLDTITDSFDIEINVPRSYPRDLPDVKDLGNRLNPEYEHVFDDGAFCLAVPVEKRRIFAEEPSLLGFVNRLVIPYLYGYCYWETFGRHPFGEQPHGDEGVVSYYIDSLGLANEVEALAIVCYLLKHGYRGHHPCPCGSGRIVRKCHSRDLRALHENHTENTLKRDFLSVLCLCSSRMESKEIQVPLSLLKQSLRLYEKLNSSR